MWRPFRALPPYFGGKRKLCPIIFREIAKALPRARWRESTFVDAFLGGGSVSLYAKGQGFGRVVCNELARRSAIVGEALIANSTVKLTKSDILRLYRPHEDNEGLLEREMVPDHFSLEQARFFDNALAVARSRPGAKRALLELVLLRVILATRPLNQFQPVEAGKYHTGRANEVSPGRVDKYVRGERMIQLSNVLRDAEAVSAGVLGGNGEIHVGDAADFVSKTQGDVLYLDPPYAGTLAYERAFKVLDRIFEEQHEVSRFSKRGSLEALSELFARAAHFPLVVLSFGNATTTIDELREIAEASGRRVRTHELKHTHMAANATEEKNRKNRELLVLAERR